MRPYGPQTGTQKRREVALRLRGMRRREWQVVADLIYVSHNQWCVANGFPPFFTGGVEQTLLFCRIYEDLDPGCCVVAENAETGVLMGACFYRERETHFALGIMSVHPNYAGLQVGRAMVAFICEAADRTGKPVRLLSPATNLDAFSLYTRTGFVPLHVYQDVIINVPESGIRSDLALSERVRPAVAADVDAMAEVELDVSGISRRRDYRYFIEDRSGCWHVSVIETDDGGIDGYLVSLGDPLFNILGPGVARSNDHAAALLVGELNVHAGRAPMVVLPVEQGDLVARAYEWGARNFDITFSQVRGELRPIRGVNLPGFLPESG